MGSPPLELAPTFRYGVDMARVKDLRIAGEVAGEAAKQTTMRLDRDPLPSGVAESPSAS